MGRKAQCYESSTLSLVEGCCNPSYREVIRRWQPIQPNYSLLIASQVDDVEAHKIRLMGKLCVSKEFILFRPQLF